MATNTILKNIVRFTGLVIGIPVSLPHLINVNGAAKTPKVVIPDVGGFTVAVDDINVTVTRSALAASGAVDVYVELWHTIEAVVPSDQLVGKVPFIVEPGASSGGAPGVDIEDEGVPIAGNPHTILNFVGGNITATDAGGGQANITVAVTAGVNIEDEGIPIPGTPHTILNFAGAGVTAADAGGGQANITIPGGGGSAVTAQQTALVDPANGSDVTGTFGNLSLPYQTIQGALDDVPLPIDAATARTVWTILVSPGTYDEDLTVDVTQGTKVILASWGPWNLGEFNTADWLPSGTLRGITITSTNATVFDNIHGSFAIEPMLPAGTGDNTQQAYSAVPRISGQIAVTLFAATPRIDVAIEAEIFGVVAGFTIAFDAETVASAVDLYIRRSRFRGATLGSTTNLKLATESRFDGLVLVDTYRRIDQCLFTDFPEAIPGGMTIVTSPAAALPGDTVIGIYECQFAASAVLTGPNGAFFMDYVTYYWILSNGASFDDIQQGSARRRLVDTANVTALPAIWRQDNVPAATGPTAMAISGSNFTSLLMIRPGYLVGISVRLTAAVSAGTLTAEVYQSGLPTGLLVTLTVGQSSGSATASITGGADFFGATLVDVRFTSSGGFTPTTTDLEAWVEVVEEAI